MVFEIFGFIEKFLRCCVRNWSTAEGVRVKLVLPEWSDSGSAESPVLL